MKRILAIITSLALLLSVVIIPSAFVVNAEETTPTYYVKAEADGGSNTNDGLSAETALATINAAQTLIAEGDTDTTGQDGTIVVIGTAEFDGGVAHTGMITIKGNDSNSKLTYKSEQITNAAGETMNAVICKGPTTFDSIYLPRKTYKDGQDILDTTNGVEIDLVSGGHEIIYNNIRLDSYSSGSQRYFYIGQVDDTPEGTREKVTFNGGQGGSSYSSNYFYFGAASNTNKASAGVDFIVNGGSASRIHTIEFKQGTTYTGNVNVVLNDFSKRSQSTVSFVNSGAKFEGAFQMIINNGRKSYFSSAAITNMNAVTATGGAWIMRCEAGVLLDTTETAGVFELSDKNMVAKAYKVTDDVAETEPTATSKKGVLDLSAAPGVYDVVFSTLEAKENTDTTVYVSADGADENEGTEESPFATIDFAQNWLNMSTAEGAKEIIVMGTVAFDGGEPHDKMITIKGYNEDAALTYIKSSFTTANSSSTKSGLVLQGPTTFDNLYLPEGSISNNCYEVVFQNMNKTKKGTYNYYFSNLNQADADKRHKVVINDLIGKEGVSNMLHITSYYGYQKMAGIDLEVNGGRLLQLNFTKTTFTGDVNVVLNDFSLRESGTDATVRMDSTFEGAFQFIANNRTLEKFSDAAKANLKSIEAAGGTWLMYSISGGKLNTTADNGVFEVISELTAKAVNTETGEAYFSEKGYLTVPEGEYNVFYIDKNNYTNTYYVSENGSDSNDGLTEETAVKTIAKAVELASNTAKIVILDTAEYDITSAYTKNITISGGTITGDITLYGDLILENTVIDASDIDTNGNTLVIGEGVSFANGKPSVITDERLLINSGDFANIKIEGNNLSKLYAYGATVESVVVATSSTEAVVKVNVEGNAELSFDGAYKTAQVIFNKTTADVTTEAENAWIVGSEESDNSTLDFTDTEGKFTATTEISKTPVAVSKDGETAYVADEFDYTYDTIDLDDSAATAHKDFINYRGGLPNVYKKLQNNEELNVVYFGGSVTAGAGLPNNDAREVDSWRAKIGNWLINTFPNSNIKNISKAAPESGTYLGTYRIPYIIAEQPDLFIIEYSINDFYYKAGSYVAAAQFETIVREVKAALPDCDIITVLVTEKAFYNSAKAGKLHEEAQAHDDVAAYYNIPSMKVGCALTSQVAYEDWSTYFADSVHPTAAGYQLYYNCIEEFFSNALLHADYDEDDEFIMPPVKSKYLYDGGRVATGITAEMLEKSIELGGKGYTHSDTYDSRDELKGYVVPSGNVGDTFCFEFYGTEVGLAFGSTDTDNFPYIRIDGGDPFIPSVASLALEPIKLATDLKSGTHRVEIITRSTTPNKINGIYYVDASAHTKQGAGADAVYKKATLNLDAGTYNVKYITSLEELTAPEKSGYTFAGWSDENGEIVTELTEGAVLTATYEKSLSEQDKLFDISGDGKIDGEDLTMVMKRLLMFNNTEAFDVNGDGKSDIRDLVALKKKIAELIPQ